MKALQVALTRRKFVLISCETLLIVCAVMLAAWIRLGPDTWTLLVIENGIARAILIAVVCQVCLYYSDMYDLRAISDRRELFTGIVQALAATSFVLAGIYFWFPSLIIGR